MIRIFKKSVGLCETCGTPVTGKYRIGDNLYCADDYEREMEKSKSEFLRKQLKVFRKLFQ